MIQIQNINQIDTDAIPIDPFWNTGDEKEFKIHRIHSYPAKFPAFITTKTLDYAQRNKIPINKIADIFCGCGTVAFEAKRNNIDFWGCDINPVATMIAKVKSHKYQIARLLTYYKSIVETFIVMESKPNIYDKANDRLKYWYSKENYEKLILIKQAIEMSVPYSSIYREFFLCAFSNILKPTSKWLTKSIKPQFDSNKNPCEPLSAFKDQCEFMISANNDSRALKASKISIITGNILDVSIKYPKVDVIITSPPYVTSYEYADLHQLSSLWLEYTQDYRKLREGTIGSLYHLYNFYQELTGLNTTGGKIVSNLLNQDKTKARSVAKYFLDMQKVARTCFNMLSPSGMALFVIGNTKYKGVKIDNASHLAESLLTGGFSEVKITKRKISKKILTPYRDAKGRFTTDGSGRKVYAEEFILIGRKK